MFCNFSNNNINNNNHDNNSFVITVIVVIVTIIHVAVDNKISNPILERKIIKHPISSKNLICIQNHLQKKIKIYKN